MGSYMAPGLCFTNDYALGEGTRLPGASHVVSKQVMDRLGKIGEQVSAGGQFEQIHSVPLQIWFIIGGAIAAPIGEEVFFRGLLYNGLKKRWGVTCGVVLSGYLLWANPCRAHIRNHPYTDGMCACNSVRAHKIAVGNNPDARRQQRRTACCCNVCHESRGCS